MTDPHTRVCSPPATLVEPPLLDEEASNIQLARYAKALGHPARVTIIRMLLRQNSCIVGDIVDVLPLAQSTVSQHLKQLKEAGLIRGEVVRPRVCYCVEPNAIALLKTLIQTL